VKEIVAVNIKKPTIDIQSSVLGMVKYEFDLSARFFIHAKV